VYMYICVYPCRPHTYLVGGDEGVSEEHQVGHALLEALEVLSLEAARHVRQSHQQPGNILYLPQDALQFPAAGALIFYPVGDTSLSPMVHNSIPLLCTDSSPLWCTNPLPPVCRELSRRESRHAQQS
jgi:hypothetical protein